MKLGISILLFGLLVQAKTCQQSARQLQQERQALVTGAGLRYRSVESFGIRRVARGRGFGYLDANGKAVSPNVKARIESLAIPPGWQSVWISQDPKSHVQATGLDSAGRMQRIYHPNYQQVREAFKFDKLKDFGNSLGDLRKQVQIDLRSSRLGGLSKQTALAAAVRLLDRSLIRVGERNGTDHYGLTTLREKHLTLSSRGGEMTFRFIGKRGVEHEIQVEDKLVAGYFRRTKKLPGYDLFQYLDEDGSRKLLSDDDVREYMKTHMGGEATPKEFRTWHAGVTAVRVLARLPVPKTEKEIQENIRMAVETVAERLGNEPSEAKESYIHPGLLEQYLQSPVKFIRRFSGAVEGAFLRFLN